MKKLLSIFLTIALVFSFATMGVSAAQQPPATGSITINGVTIENDITVATYKVYKILDLKSYDTSKAKYSYKLTDDEWANFFKSVEGGDYVTIGNEDYVTWKGDTSESRKAEFAKKALAYAQRKNISPVKTTIIPPGGEKQYSINENSITFSNLELGYYLVDSTVGALCGLTTTNPAASINAKNIAPTLMKQVKEDLTAQWGTANTADIGQTIEYRVTINVHAGAQNYVLHDKMGSGLSFKGVEKVIHVVSGGSSAGEVATAGTHYNVLTGEDVSETIEKCTFEVEFTEDFCNHLGTNDKIEIYYIAELNKNAVIAEGGNKNEAWMTFGEENTTESSITITKTFAFDLIKTDGQNMLLDGASFELYDTATGGTPIIFIKTDEKVYRKTDTTETGSTEATGTIVASGGKVRVKGLDNGTYYLQETVTPAGYNALTARKAFSISDGNLDATFNGDIYSTGSGVQVVNNSGSMLPETGAGGKVMFITFGTIVVLGTGVLLVTKKRMSMIDD